MKLSVLDQSTAAKGRTQDCSIRETLAYAKRCDELGYHRYWVSEHHNSGNIVGTAPEVLLAAIGATTQRIRIGSAGVMLPHYSAYKVAEQFRVIESIAPGRVDLGVGRAPGSDRLTSMALNPHPDDVHDQFPRQIQEMQCWLSGTPLPDGHPFQRVVAHPTGPTFPTMWVLGSSDYGAQLAAHLGLPYAFAYFFMDGAGVEQALHLYRTLYRPSARHPQPQATICVWALVADTDEHAQHLALSRDRWRADRMRGVFGPLRSPDEVAHGGFTADEAQATARSRRKAFVGSPSTVAARLRDRKSTRLNSSY